MTPEEHDAYVDELKAWLRSKNKTREDFATDLGAKKGTLDNWFSKGFPDWAIKSITRLRSPTETDTSGLEVTFTAAEFELIEKARLLTEHTTRAAFYHAAIMDYTDELLASEKDDAKQSPHTVIQGQPAFTVGSPSNITPMPPQHFSDNIAADPSADTADIPPAQKVSYGSGKKKTKGA